MYYFKIWSVLEMSIDQKWQMNDQVFEVGLRFQFLNGLY
jgi:hypothetical protein